MLLILRPLTGTDHQDIEECGGVKGWALWLGRERCQEIRVVIAKLIAKRLILVEAPRLERVPLGETAVRRSLRIMLLWRRALALVLDKCLIAGGPKATVERV